MKNSVYELPNTFLLVKGGIPNKTTTSNQEYYDISFSIESQTGYIAQKGESNWKLYLSEHHIIEKHKVELKNSKFYFRGESFEQCKNEAERILEKVSIIVSRNEINKIQLAAKS